MSKKKKSKKTLEDRSPPTFEELYAATGGARLGMRARMSQKGKIARAEKESSILSHEAPCTIQSPSDVTHSLNHEVGNRENEKEKKKLRKSEKKIKKRKRESDDDDGSSHI